MAEESKGGTKSDQGKTEWSLLPLEALEGCTKVLMFGAKKYDRHNWRKGMLWSRIYDALFRHLKAWWGGEDLDPETGLSHLDHALCELIFLRYYEQQGRYGESDDRFKNDKV